MLYIGERERGEGGKSLEERLFRSEKLGFGKISGAFLYFYIFFFSPIPFMFSNESIYIYGIKIKFKVGLANKGISHMDKSEILFNK